MIPFAKKQVWSSVVPLMMVLLGTIQETRAGGGSVSMKPASNKVDKVKIQMLQAYAQAMSTSAGKILPTTAGVCDVGIFNSTKCIVHPLVVSYIEEIDSSVSPARDVWAAVSLDDGQTWKRTNLSRQGGSENQQTYSGPHCFTVESEDDGDHESSNGRLLHDEGEPAPTQFTFYADADKPAMVSKGNEVLVAWTGSNCKGGVPGGDQGEDPGNYLSQSGDAAGASSDTYQVKGKQRCHDYTNEMPGLGQQPFNCVWTARGIINSKGEIVWTKPERITSGRRDANQLTAAVAGNKAGWALSWQEDPKGLRVGEAAGPGDGMSGATVNHKTDIWYSFLPGTEFSKCSNGVCAQPDDSTKPEVLTRFSSPVRVTDNAACKVFYDTDGVRSVKGGPYCSALCSDDANLQEEENGYSCIKDGYPLNGKTGAARPNMFLIPKGVDDAEVVLAYEETKGMGLGGEKNEDGTEKEDEGKNIFFHHFPTFKQPNAIEHGTMMNTPETDANGMPLLSSDGTTYLTKNARRVRLIIQPPSNWGKSKVSMVALYREGNEGHGKPAHILMRRFIGGYEPDKLECNGMRQIPGTGRSMCVRGPVDITADNTPDPGEEDDARAHRGFIRGDMLVVGYTYTPKWGRGEAHRYDFYIRRSFDGGKKWSNYRGQPEDPVNISNIKDEGNPGWSVMEPRIFATPGTIGQTPLHKNDVQNSMVFFIAYGTTQNPHVGQRELTDDDEEGPADSVDVPKDLYWSMTNNFGETYAKVWNDEAGKSQFPFLAHARGPDVDAQFSGAQVVSNPAGKAVYASYQALVQGSGDSASVAVEGVGGGPCNGNGVGSDACFNSTSYEPILNDYDLNGDGVVNNLDVTFEKTKAKKDFDGDGTYTGHDWKLVADAVVEYDRARAALNGRRLHHTYLRSGP